MSHIPRRTGKTTKLLNEAIGFAQLGNYVIFITANEDMASQLAATTVEMAGGARRVGGNKVYTGNCGEISFLAKGSQDLGKFDFTRGIAFGAFPTVRIFVDHYTLEQFMAKTCGWAWYEWLRQTFQQK